MFRSRVSGRCIAAALVVWVACPVFADKPLPSDPNLVTGKLDNGVTWIHRRHANPPGRMSLVMRVDCGSLNETDEQRGVAHFLEHLVFNGSENFGPGDLTAYFERLGMKIGADLNAQTSYDSTLYALDLPNTSEAEVNQALMALSDFAFRAKLDKEQIDQERGIIMEEKRGRTDPQQRILDKLFPELFFGSHFAMHNPIGVAEVIEHAPREMFVDFYRTWYRPENMTLIIVGDASHESCVPLIQKWFGTYQPETPARPAPGAGLRDVPPQRAIVVTDKDLSKCQVQLVQVRPPLGPAVTFEAVRTQLTHQIASFIMSRRFDALIQSGDAPFHGASAGVGDFFNEALMVSANAVGEPDDWNRMLDQLIAEIARAHSYGFLESELDLARRFILSSAERGVRMETSQSAKTLLSALTRAVNSGDTYTSAEQTLAIMHELLPTISRSDVNDAFNATFVPERFTFVMTYPAERGDVTPTREAVLAAGKAAFDRKVEPRTASTQHTTLIQEEPKPGTIAETTRDEELGITHVWLDNGVRVHHRYMDYKGDTLYLSIAMAGGRIEESARNAGITEAASLAFSRPATSRLNSTEIADLMVGRNVAVNGSAANDTLTFQMTGSPRDLEFGMQLAYALMTDAVIEESSLQNWKQQTLQQIRAGQRDPQFKAFETFIRLVSGNDPRRTIMDPIKLDLITLPAAQAWLDRLRREAPIEVALVGDVKWDDARPLIEKYLGALPQRTRNTDYLDPLRRFERDKGPLTSLTRVPTESPRATVIYGFMGANATDYADARALEIAANVLSMRMFRKLREELALVYSIGASNTPSRAFRDAGVFMTTSPCDPDKVEALQRELTVMFADFADRGPDAEELRSAKKQIRNDIELAAREPSYWWNVLQNLDLHGVSLVESNREPTAYEPITAEQVRDVFARYFIPERQFFVATAPAPLPEQPLTGQPIPRGGPAIPAKPPAGPIPR